MATSPLDSLCKLEAVRLVDAVTIDSFLAGDGARVLFFTGDPKQRPDVQDVAVVLRELVRAHGAKLPAAVVAREAEASLMPVHGVIMLPSLVFLRGGKFLSVLAKIQDWSVYDQAARAALAPVAVGG